MSIFGDVLNVVSEIAKLVPGASLISAGIDLFKTIMDKAMPLMNDLIQASPLPDAARSLMSEAYEAGWG